MENAIIRAMTLTTTPITVPAIAPLLRAREEPVLEPLGSLELLLSDAFEDEFVMHEVLSD